MRKTVTYYLALVSPWAYLGSQHFTDLVTRYDAQVQIRPIDLSEVFPKTGGLPLAKRAPARQAYRLQELERWPEARGLPLTLHPRHFPSPEQTAAHMVIAADLAGADALGLAHAMLRAVWAEERNIDDEDTLRAVADEQGLDGANLLAQAKEPEIAARRSAYSAQALEDGVFGVPSYLIDGELFWGQDRLDFVEARLKG